MEACSQYSVHCHIQAHGRAFKYKHNSFRIVDGVCANAEFEHVGDMDYTCIYCKAMLFKDEIIQPGTLAQPSSYMCCAHGTVQLAAMKDAPPLLKSLLEGDHPLPEPFLLHIRKYNSALSMASNKFCLETKPGG